MADKTIRYNIDDKGVSQSNEKIRRSFEETQKKVLDAQKESKRLSRDEIADIEKKIKLQEQLNRQKEEQLKREIEDRNISVQRQKLELENWKRRRREQAEGMTGGEREAFVRETAVRSGVRQESISRQKSDILDRKKEYTETRDSGRKQITELRNITDTIKKESLTGRRDTGMLMNRIVGGASSSMSGGLAGTISGVGMMVGGPMAIIGGLAMLANMTKGYQQNLRQFAVSTQLPASVANMMAPGFRNSALGMSSNEMMAKSGLFTSNAGKWIMGGELSGLMGAQISRGLSDQQMAQLLSIQRYSGTSALGTVSGFENYMKAGNKSLIKLPELLSSYLSIANSILQKTGRVDAISLQQTMMSVGKSYGVQGIGLDRMMNNLTTVSGNSSNSILRAIQMETLRSMNPNMTTWQMQGILENPTKNPEYMKQFINRMSKFGGGGDWTKFALLNMGFGSTSEIEKIVGGNFELAGRPTDSGGKATQDKYVNEAGKYVGSLEKVETMLGSIKDLLMQNLSKISDDITSAFTKDNVRHSLQSSVYHGTSQALKENRR